MATRGIFDTDGFVTSEAVRVDLPTAPLPMRMLSGLIDLLVVAALVTAAVALGLGRVLTTDGALARVVGIVLTVAVLLALPVTLETRLHGRTLGKLALGLRTVRDDTGPIGFRHALVRALVGVVELWLTAGGLALIVAASNERARRIGDFAAGTFVVRERVRLQIPPAPQMPPQLAGWAVGADIGVVPDSLAVAVRQFLARSAAMTPPSRAATGHQLCLDLIAYVSPAPPPWAPAEAVLAAVLAERRRRDLLRLERDDRLRARVLGPDPLG